MTGRELSILIVSESAAVIFSLAGMWFTANRIGKRINDLGRRLDEMGRRLDGLGRRIDQMITPRKAA